MLSPSANFDIQIVSNNNLYDLVETPLIGSIYLYNSYPPLPQEQQSAYHPSLSIDRLYPTPS